ncbi:hypothetical protein Godav_028561, partial [Gossypium davidsonii]|nr:hypothetical protein [Gossypium davidsonii]
MKGGRKRVSQSEGGGRGGSVKEKKKGGTEEEIVETEGLGEKKEEEEEQEEEEDDDDEDDEEEEEEEEEEGKEEENGERKEDERTKLDDGFFEIEAIRRKRVRKLHLLLIISVFMYDRVSFNISSNGEYPFPERGWPETANTWEPLENLQSCSDVIDAFEESLRSGKHSRKRKRKYGGPHTQSKKKQPCSSGSTYNVTGLELGGVDKTPLVPFDNSGIADLSASSTVIVLAREGERNGNSSNFRRARRVKDNSSANGSKKIDETKDENDYDTKLSELKGALSSKGGNTDKLAIRFQEGKASEGDGPVNGLQKVDLGESVQSDRRTGAKRRKSGSVKRFTQDPASSGPNLTQNATNV